MIFLQLFFFNLELVVLLTRSHVRDAKRGWADAQPRRTASMGTGLRPSPGCP
jgi:hypothetical protein